MTKILKEDNGRISAPRSHIHASYALYTSTAGL